MILTNHYILRFLLKRYKEKLTITEIAKKAGVSIGTVDRVIHNRGHVSEEKKKLIDKILLESEYSPNPIAKMLKQNKPFVIGILMPSLNSEGGYWQMIFQGIQKAISELEPFSISVIYSEFNRLKEGCFTEAAQYLLSKKVDSLLIAPVNQKESLALLEKISIPYVFVDSPLPNTKPLMTVAQNPYQSGYCAARIMSLLCPHATHLLTIQMHKNTYNLTQRALGFEAFYSTNKEINVKSYVAQENNLTSKTQKDFFDSVFTENNLIDGIFVTNDSVFNLVSYIKQYQKEKQIKIVGYDLLAQNCDLLKEGCIDCLISQSPEIQGYDAIYSIYRKEILLQEPENNVAVPILTFFKESI